MQLLKTKSAENISEADTEKLKKPIGEQQLKWHRLYPKKLWRTEGSSLVVQAPSPCWFCDPYELQHVRFPYPSLSPWVCTNSHPLSHDAIHLILCHPLLLLPSIIPSIRVFSSIGALASASVLPKNILDWFPLGLTGMISLLSKGFPRVLSCTRIQKHQFFRAQPSLWANPHTHTWLQEKP